LGIVSINFAPIESIVELDPVAVSDWSSLTPEYEGIRQPFEYTDAGFSQTPYRVTRLQTNLAHLIPELAPLY
jgi:hypothetical protein